MNELALSPFDARVDATPLRAALRRCRGLFLGAALFSLLANLLMLAQPLYMLQIYDRVLSSGRVETLLMLTLIVATAVVVMVAIEAARNILLSRIGHWLEEWLAPELLNASVKARVRGEPGGAQLLGELGKVRAFISAQGLGVFFDAPWVPIFVLLLFVLHPWIGALALVTAIVMLVLAVLTEFCSRRPLKAASIAQSRAGDFADGAIRNAEVVAAMGMCPALASTWSHLNRTASHASEEAGERMTYVGSLARFVRLIAQVGVLGVGAFLVLQQELTAGGMIAGSIILSRALAPVEQAVGAWRQFSEARLGRARIDERLASFPNATSRTQLPEPEGELAVEEVGYRPPGAARPIVDDVSFVVRPGEALAVIGPSAAGKSTLCRLLIGIYQPNIGSIRLDGVELHKWDPQALGRYIGYLPQDVELFDGTVRANIARMRDDVPDAAVVEAAMLAHAHDMIVQLPDGYETQIGDSGMRLSGGQRQRIGLARALFGAPKLIVLDEPNANLDQAGESALAAAIGELKGRGATIVIVGHRPSTLHQVDDVMVLQDGEVAAFGPRDRILGQLRHPARPDEAETPPAALLGERA
jgi:PrtD family type I secretion system ABC transporter